jgi:hypothetical protein
MPRDRSHARQMRERIAHLAARLMAEDGIGDFSLAKRKAARQAGGAPDTRNLPTNEEVESALRSYQRLYQADEQKARLRHLREQARGMMALLSRFNPYLTGSVLSGSAGKYSDINIHLFTDSAKDVEMFLIDRKIPYRSHERRVYVGEDPRNVPVFNITGETADFDVLVFGEKDLREQIRSSPDGRPFDRARATWLAAELDGAT